ncbi:nuclear pore complex protein Nup85-like [Sinocyclocheilus grahami]|uniref:nuclear pore complex protein Nup85-like n=1 Tax=Sinocyclocheilus grahami TaxID=75366 RepID=UPI0007AD1194|nr:PREDICTED: nuclear pore complex protein Nup85-like [Sinocyclocheilus grahami]
MEEVDVEPSPTLIPSAGFHQRHLGFEWGPGDLLVYETNYKLQGPRSAGSPFVHVVWKDEDICSPILRKLFNESHLIFVGLQKIKEDVPSKNKKSQFVSISKNYRSVIRACMEELQQNAVSTQEGSLASQYGDQVSILLAIELIWNLCEVLFIDAAPAGSLLLHLLDWVRLHKSDVDARAREVLQSDSPAHHQSYWDVVISLVLQGRVDEARQVLSKQASLRAESSSVFKRMDVLLHTMPIFNVRTSFPKPAENMYFTPKSEGIICYSRK